MSQCDKCRDVICRCDHIYEGPGGTPRDKRDYSPNKRLKITIGDLIKDKR